VYKYLSLSTQQNIHKNDQEEYMKSIRGKIKKYYKHILALLICVLTSMMIALITGKMYQHWDNDPDRGAMAIQNGYFDEHHGTPIYLDQGWSNAQTLWYYNTTQGSNLIPYDFFIALEQKDSTELFRSNKNFDKYRYLPQKKTFFNPDALAVGFVKDSYKGHDYIGYTCAACHTAQINFQGQAIRIDGGPAMADMASFLTALSGSLQQTLNDSPKKERFIDSVLALNNNYKTKKYILDDLKKWTQNIQQYNIVNHSDVEYGYARLDAFGRIYNRLLEHIINKHQVKKLMLLTSDENHERLLTRKQVNLILEGINETIIGSEDFALIIQRLLSDDAGYPNLSMRQVKLIRDQLFNEPNAPVSYPFLWDITHSDYVQWNGISSNAGIGPLGRNAGQVMGVFAKLDWEVDKSWFTRFSLSAKLSGQNVKNEKIKFDSSINLINLQRLESQLHSLKSPLWPEHILGKINPKKVKRGELLYDQYCISCHEIIDRNNWDRVVIAKMSALERVKTDPAMAENSVNYTGKSGNFQHTYQKRNIGNVIIEEEAPVALVLPTVMAGVVTTPDADKWFLRRWLDWLYVFVSSFFDNSIKPSVRNGQYLADTTAQPFNSLLSYKARSLNGIWATAPYLHNGSVPTLYDLLLPTKRENDPDNGEYRPNQFIVGSREFDPIKMGFKSSGYDGFIFSTEVGRGNLNSGHEYAAGRTAQPNGTILPALTKSERLDLLEFIKTL